MGKILQRFDIEVAKSIVGSFTHATGVPCRLLGKDGQVLYEAGEGEESCRFCRLLEALTGDQLQCDQLHQHGIRHAEKFGGRYIYFCPAGMAYFAAPIFTQEQRVGALVGGPVLIMDIDDYLAGDAMSKQGVPDQVKGEFRLALELFARREPAQLGHLSALLCAGAVYVGDNSRALFLARQQDDQQRAIGEHMQRLKQEERGPYPRNLERDLVRATTEGDQATARRLLNELLGYILFSTGGAFAAIRARTLELMALLSRAALDGGADGAEVFQLTQRGLEESDRLRATPDLVSWITQIMEKLTNHVFQLGEIRHKDIIYKSLDYMKRGYGGKITLEETAQAVGLSPSYFSKIFKEEMNRPFNTYLNEIRVERGKALLLDGALPIIEICARVGFDDQSYFTKVFKKHTGVTPAKFREFRGRLEHARERIK